MLYILFSLVIPLSLLFRKSFLIFYTILIYSIQFDGIINNETYINYTIILKILDKVNNSQLNMSILFSFYLVTYIFSKAPVLKSQIPITLLLTIFLLNYSSHLMNCYNLCLHSSSINFFLTNGLLFIHPVILYSFYGFLIGFYSYSYISYLNNRSFSITHINKLTHSSTYLAYIALFLGSW